MPGFSPGFSLSPALVLFRHMMVVSISGSLRSYRSSLDVSTLVWRCTRETQQGRSAGCPESLGNFFCVRQKTKLLQSSDWNLIFFGNFYFIIFDNK